MDEGTNTPIESPDSPAILSSQVEPQKSNGRRKIILITTILVTVTAILFGILYVLITSKSPSEVKTDEVASSNQAVTAVDRANSVAIINNKPIMRADFERELKSHRESTVAAGPALDVQLQYQSPPSDGYSPGASLLELGAIRTTRISKLEGKEAESAILDSMIWEELLIQEAKKGNISMSEKQLDATLRSYFGEKFAAALSIPEQDVKIHGYSSIEEGTAFRFALGYVGPDSAEMSKIAADLAAKSIAERSQIRERLRRTTLVSSFHEKISLSAAGTGSGSFDEEVLVETLRNKSNVEILLDGYVKPQPVTESRKDQFIRSGISNLLYGIEAYFSDKGTYIGVQAAVLQSRKEDIQTIVENGGSPADLIIQERENAWCVSSTLNSGKKFCLDSTGKGGDLTSYCTNAMCPISGRESVRLQEFKDINGMSFTYPEGWKQENIVSQGTIHITLHPLGDDKNTIVVNTAPSTGQERGIESFISVKSSETTAGGVTWKTINLDGATDTSGLLLPDQKAISASYKDTNKSISYAIEAFYETKNDAQMQEAFTKVLQSVSFK